MRKIVIIVIRVVVAVGIDHSGNEMPR